MAGGAFADRIVAVEMPGGKAGPIDRRPATSIRAPTRRSTALAKLKPIVRAGGTVTAGNASGVNDGARR